jgi:hypothetical protein
MEEERLAFAHQTFPLEEREEPWELGELIDHGAAFMWGMLEQTEGEVPPPILIVSFGEQLATVGWQTITESPFGEQFLDVVVPATLNALAPQMAALIAGAVLHPPGGEPEDVMLICARSIAAPAAELVFAARLERREERPEHPSLELLPTAAAQTWIDALRAGLPG